MNLQIMIKEYKISDILGAVESIYKTERKKAENLEKENNMTDNDSVLTLNNQVKSTKSDILVLDQMIE